ncbi:hypothetical protein Q2357_14315, partial [Proteus mirabilis]
KNNYFSYSTLTILENLPLVIFNIVELLLNVTASHIKPSSFIFAISIPPFSKGRGTTIVSIPPEVFSLPRFKVIVFPFRFTGMVIVFPTSQSPVSEPTSVAIFFW